MNALVISDSLVVLELLKLVLNKKDINAEFVNSAKNADDINYDIIFIDDSNANVLEEINFIKSNFNYKNIVLLGNNDSSLVSLVDISIKKPFLPADIEKIIDNLEEVETIKTNILDPNEIAKLKALMDDNIIEKNGNKDKKELNLVDELKSKNSLKLKNKKAKKFIKELCKLKKSELKKLLKDAKIKIKVEF